MAAGDRCKLFKITFPHEYVAHVEINRPEKLNVFSPPMWLEMRRLFNQISHDPAVRAIVLSGAGDRAFSAGLDIEAATQDGFVHIGDQSGDSSREAVRLRRQVVEFQDCISAVERCEKPVIAAIHGHSLGLAIDLVTATDIRMCARDTAFGIKEVDIGLAADVGTLTRLPKVVGSGSWSKEVALTGRVFGADEALRVGFVSSVHDSKEATVRAALDLAILIASKSPVAVQGTKELLNWSRDHTVQDGLRYTAVWNSAMLQTGDITAALKAGRKSRPTFEKL